MTKIQHEFDKLLLTISSQELKNNKSLRTPIARIKNALNLLDEGERVNLPQKGERGMLRFLDVKALGLTLI